MSDVGAKLEKMISKWDIVRKVPPLHLWYGSTLESLKCTITELLEDNRIPKELVKEIETVLPTLVKFAQDYKDKVVDVDVDYIPTQYQVLTSIEGVEKLSDYTKMLVINEVGDYLMSKIYEDYNPDNDWSGYFKAQRMERGLQFNKQERLEDYAMNQKLRTAVQCYKQCRIEGVGQRKIGIDLGISQQTVSAYVKTIEGMLDRDLGNAFEEFFRGMPEEYDIYKKQGGRGEPDAIGYKYDLLWKLVSIGVMSLKCHDLPDKPSESIPRSELRPEIEHAKRLRADSALANVDVKAVLYYYELSRHRLWKKEIDLWDEDQKITIRFDVDEPETI